MLLKVSQLLTAVTSPVPAVEENHRDAALQVLGNFVRPAVHALEFDRWEAPADSTRRHHPAPENALPQVTLVNGSESQPSNAAHYARGTRGKSFMQ